MQWMQEGNPVDHLTAATINTHNFDMTYYILGMQLKMCNSAERLKKTRH